MKAALFVPEYCFATGACDFSKLFFYARLISPIPLALNLWGFLGKAVSLKGTMSDRAGNSGRDEMRPDRS